MGLAIIAIILLAFLVYMCIDSFKMAKESGEGLEAGLVLGASLACVAFIIFSCIL